jgi:hypothetical protein
MPRLLTIVIVAAALSGCRTETDVLATGASPVELSPAASSAIAGDLASRFAEQVGQGTGTIVLREDTSSFGQALVAALKGWGYAVATHQKTDNRKPTIQLAYTIDEFEGQTLARLSTGKVELTRAYRTTAGGATPGSPLSVMQRN